MRIGIDARLIEETGVGRYIRNLIAELSEIDTEHEYVVFLRKKSFDAFLLPNARWQKRLADVPWHTAKEQLVMPMIFLKEKLDMLHVPYFNVPIFYPRRYIVTIHDVTILHLNTGKATRLPLPYYWFKRIGYYCILLLGLARATHIIAVSETTKQEVMDHFGINTNDITVAYEGVDKELMVPKERKKKQLIPMPYILYVGNAYPHKNLELLVDAFGVYSANSARDIHLVFVGPEDLFYQRLKEHIAQRRLEKSIQFFGKATDSQLQDLYSQARVFVFPSLMEGFGLPGLEAMTYGVPVLCADIPVFREIFSDAAMYFNPRLSRDLVKKLEYLLHDKKEIARLGNLGKQRAAKFSWKHMARQTKTVYELRP